MEQEFIGKQRELGDVTAQLEYQDIAGKFIKSTFNRGTTEKVMATERNVRVKKIVNAPVNYVVVKAFYENREIENSKEATKRRPSKAPRIMGAGEYDRWEIRCPEPKVLFRDIENEIIIEESKHVAECEVCGSEGKMGCDCNKGKEVCSACRGRGGWSCDVCGGDGQVKCKYCNGSGKNVKREVIGYDKNNQPVYDNVSYTCVDCGGNGKMECDTCDGVGYVHCTVCNRTGQVTCHKCKGTCKVTCESCTGAGFFLHYVKINQEFGTDICFQVLDSYDENRAVYGDGFAPFVPYEKDILIAAYESDEPMDEFPAGEILSYTHDKPYNVKNLVNRLEDKRRACGIAKRFLRHRIEVYQRDVLEISYEFQNNVFKMMVDTSTGQILMNKNPYENVVENLTGELRQIYKKGDFSQFLIAYQEISNITKDDESLFVHKKVLRMMKKLVIKNGIMAILGSVLALVFMNLPILNFKQTFVPEYRIVHVIASVLGLGASVLSSCVWKRFAFPTKWKTYGTVVGVAASITMLITVLFVACGL